MIESLVSEIHGRTLSILERIVHAAERSGRDPKSVKLVVVSKSQTVETVRAAVMAGARILGENYAEEAAEKIQDLKDESGVEWHMIGHVQGRKASLVVNNFSMLHSLDSVKLAERLERHCAEVERSLRVMLEFNMSGEESKFGWKAWDVTFWQDLLPGIKKILMLPHILVCGLMTMPPYFDQPEASRPFFQRLRKLQEFLEKQFPQGKWQELSMGTSADFEVAVEEGATYVRIGQAILGARKV